MGNRVCFVSIDAEQDRLATGIKFHGVEELEKILDFFRRYGVRATIFTTGQVLERYNGLAKNWAKFHEIACHGFTHRFWDTLDKEERNKELEDFIDLYQKVFGVMPKGFRAPSHVIDKEGLGLLSECGFSYDSSIVPHYPPFKKYRGYKGRMPLLPYYPEGLRILEIPVRGQILGIPLASAWMNKLPHWLYDSLFRVYCPDFITLSMHSWDSLNGKSLINLDKTLNLLTKKGYLFLNGEQILENYR